MTFFWGSNFSIIKAAIREMPGPGSTACAWCSARSCSRRSSSSAMAFARVVVAVERRDWIGLVALGVGRPRLYQLLFLAGVARRRSRTARSSSADARHRRAAARRGSDTSASRRMRWAGVPCRWSASISSSVRRTSRRRVAGGRPADRRGDALLGDLHRGIAAAARTLLAPRVHRPDDGDWQRAVRAVRRLAAAARLDRP